MTTTIPSTDLPVPREALLELGLTEEQIAEAEASRPLTLAFQANEQPNAYFDVERVKKALKALAQFKHTKGRWAGKPMTIAGGGLAPWQVVWVIAPVFGWVYFDEEADAVVRVVRAVWVEVPRKNGKSTVSSGIANILLLADGEMGAEVYAAAGSLDQAKRVFDDAKRMCLTSKHARSKVRALAEVISVPHTGGVFRALSKIAEVAHGLNVHGGVVDEVHVYKSRHLVDAIETGTGARAQPLIIFITTADEATEGSIYDEKHSYTRKVADRVVLDPSHYGVIWAAEDTDDPFAEETWRKANPGLGVSPSLTYIRKEANKAQTTPSYFPTFCRLHLNRRMRDTSRLIDLNQWDGTAGMTDLARLAGRRAWGGLDLSAVSDFTAWWMGVESWQAGVELEMFWRFYVPADRVDDLARQLQVPLKQWIKEGFVKATEGNVIDYSVIKADALVDCKRVDMQRISYDRMFAGQMVQELDAELKGVEMAPVAQTFLGTSPAIKEMQRLLGKSGQQDGPGRIRHGGNPVARWMASVVEVKNDGQDNLRLVKPDRQKAQARIDGISACVNGLDGYLRRPKQKKYQAHTA
ncbi:terminase large subunit [Kibdelosporangium aridum]|uniref:Terminase large subunit n=1 Tax=Kibdelosporangium aridum TaxID=2030 RepID=A0A428YUZ9_KIBAR|nr:terminase TerL endonuclease subunit [Kibdelosporangium aridum]RSM73461.1 terminase large subunit [Kibdelosporangium aridum]